MTKSGMNNPGVPASPSGCQPTASAAEEASSQSGIPNAEEAVIDDIQSFPANFAGNCLSSIAISLKRMVQMMEEDRRPRLELVLPDGVEEAGAKHRRLLLEGLEAERHLLDRIAIAIEAVTAETVKLGSVHESADPKGIARKEAAHD